MTNKSYQRDPQTLLIVKFEDHVDMICLSLACSMTEKPHI